MASGATPATPATGPWTSAPFNNGEGAAFFVAPFSPPAPCYVCPSQPEGAGIDHSHISHIYLKYWLVYNS